MKERSRNNQGDYVLQILINKYRADPDGFSSYLPEVTQEIEKVLSSPSKKSHTSKLTELERERLCELLLRITKKKTVSQKEAIQALEYCATLVQDESLPNEVDRHTLLNLLRQATNISYSKVKENSMVPLGQGEVIKEIALLRGVYLHLTWNDRLVAISIFPAKFKERSQALKFVGIAEDTASNVSEHHDIYLIEER